MQLQKNLIVIVIVIVIAVSTVALAGCTTIAFFPTAPAQKAADKLIDDIWPAAPARPAAVQAPVAAPAKDATKDVAKADTEKTEARK
jgi:flagellar basal body-associated protein FliL